MYLMEAHFPLSQNIEKVSHYFEILSHCSEILSHYFKKVSHYNDFLSFFFIALVEMDFHV